MKKLSFFLALAAAALTVACADQDEAVPADVASGNVTFVTRTPRTLAAGGPVYTDADYRILAFRRADAGTDYVYLKDIPMGGMQFDGTTISGTVQLAAGDYKFLPSYGLVTVGNYTWCTLDAAVLSNDLYITHTEGTFPAVFMLNQPLSAVKSYPVSLDGPKQTVQATLHRSVSRVDVLFIRATKDADGKFVEQTGENVFGPEQLATAELRYTGANSRLGLSGEKVDGTFNSTHKITAPNDVVTIGTAPSTTVERTGFDFEDVKPSDIISGSAYMKGTYLIPNADATPTIGFEMLLTSGRGSERTITLANPIPVERNKATLVRVYVLGENVFTTGVDFSVEVSTVWDGSNTVDHPID